MRLLFVCMGNICRSPTAEGVFRKLAEDIAPDLALEVDSAGTHAYHVGEPPDARSQAAAARRDIDLSGIRARRVARADFAEFDLVLAMDRTNHAALMEICPETYHSRVRLFLEILGDPERLDVPDPYYGGATGFEHVLDLVEEGARALITSLRQDARNSG